MPYDSLDVYGVQIHSGFDAYWQIIRPKVLEVLVELDPTYEFVFMGHSLGGALAQLASLDYQFQHNLTGNSVNISCVTFGAPRVGNWQFSRLRNGIIPNTLNVEVVSGLLLKKNMMDSVMAFPITILCSVFYQIKF